MPVLFYFDFAIISIGNCFLGHSLFAFEKSFRLIIVKIFRISISLFYELRLLLDTCEINWVPFLDKLAFSLLFRFCYYFNRKLFPGSFVTAFENSFRLIIVKIFRIFISLFYELRLLLDTCEINWVPFLDKLAFSLLFRFCYYFNRKLFSGSFLATFEESLIIVKVSPIFISRCF